MTNGKLCVKSTHMRDANDMTCRYTYSMYMSLSSTCLLLLSSVLTLNIILFYIIHYIYILYMTSYILKFSTKARTIWKSCHRYNRYYSLWTLVLFHYIIYTTTHTMGCIWSCICKHPPKVFIQLWIHSHDEYSINGVNVHKEIGIYNIKYMVKLGYKYVTCRYLVAVHRLNYLPPTNK